MRQNLRLTTDWLIIIYYLNVFKASRKLESMHNNKWSEMFVYLQFSYKKIHIHANFDLFCSGASEMRESISIRIFLLSILRGNITFKFEIISQAVSEHSFILVSVCCKTVVVVFFL